MYGGDWESPSKATTFDVLWAGNADLGAVRFISGGSNGRTYLYEGGATRYSDLGLSAVFGAPIAGRADPNFVAWAQNHDQMVANITQARVDKALAQVDFEAGIGLNLMFAPTLVMGGGGAGYGVSRASLSTIVPRVAATNTRVLLQGVTDRAVADLAANPALARSLMSPGSYMHLVEGTKLAPASYGKAVERLSAQYVSADPVLSQVLSYQSRPFVATPDFLGYEGYGLRALDITTEASRASHLARPYGAYTEIVTHPGLPPNLVFPR